MKTVEVKQESWHYWLASNFGGWQPHHTEDRYEIDEDTGRPHWAATKIVEHDFCKYVRHVIVGTVIALIVLLSAATLLVVEGVMLLNIYTTLFRHQEFIKLSQVTAAIDVLALFFAIMVGGTVFFKYIERRSRDVPIDGLTKQEKRMLRAIEREKAKENSFIRNAYLAFKDKVCFKLKVTE